MEQLFKCSALLVILGMVLDLAMSASFSELFEPNWAPDHILNEGNLTRLSLDTNSGCGFQSKSTYLFGKVNAEIKLIEGDSAGTVTAFYMRSEGFNHDELDFEFLGNVSGEPYLIQTNVYTNGTGDREQRHTLWFDPTADFHTYAVSWTRYSIVFLVDEIPIRVYANKEEEGVLFPKSQAMGIYGSVWNADDWATQGGRVKTNWSDGPFVSWFRSFGVDACELKPDDEDNMLVQCRESDQFWWNKPAMGGLSRHKTHQLKWVRAKHLVYDYCKDTTRFAQLPKECVN
ncbi:Glycoside hydrolase family 16 [Dillenia turbinata]|uniref:Xyloglucan endotransglucosylase/hydrolase n=1 Tax=Dillenia turbinata TaxID=194707 RepID=A0AAN8UQI3_9MAGN